MPETEYQGLPIRKHSLAVRGAGGDALSGVLRVKPQDFHAGVPIFVLLEVMPGPVRFDPMDEGDAWDQVQITKVARGTIVDEATAKPLLDEVTVALEDLRVQETGQERLSLSSEIDRQVSEHERGLHKRKGKGCPMCHPVSDEDVARLEEFEMHQREVAMGDPLNPLPAARKRRSRAKK